MPAHSFIEAFSSAYSRSASFQLLAKEWTLDTGKLLLRDFTKSSMASLT